MASSQIPLDFEMYIVQRDDSGVWRRCPYCGQKIWDGVHNKSASGFLFHLNTKVGAHTEKPEWKEKFAKGSWHLGTQKGPD
jgi:hypothetical protein